jgi:hypothetical protein
MLCFHEANSVELATSKCSLAYHGPSVGLTQLPFLADTMSIRVIDSPLHILFLVPRPEKGTDMPFTESILLE